jgi:Co/Zn/Cd efflux system component
MDDVATNRGLRRVVRRVAAVNLGYFGIEFAVALAIGSVALFADSIDFLEDTSMALAVPSGDQSQATGADTATGEAP